MAAGKRIGVAVLNFGEPEQPSLEEVVPFLERIFLINARLEGEAPSEERLRRARELAVARAPGLVAEYEDIGGSPLHRQAAEQADALREELARRGTEVRTYLGMQFTHPLIEEAVRQARTDGVEVLVALPVYPLAGPSTTVAALAQLARAVEAQEWDVDLREISGWHRHPEYTRLRADGIRALAAEHHLDLLGGQTRVVFSAHGTPISYLQAGSRYEEYVNEHCRALAAELGVTEYTLGYQNHTNRPVEWTQPDIDKAVHQLAEESRAARAAEAGGWRGSGKGAGPDGIVVVPISFMHEQSETLAELDHELREVADEAGLHFHRVPVPHDDPRFAAILADLVEATLGAGELTLGLCRCRATERTVCTNQ